MAGFFAMLDERDRTALLDLATTRHFGAKEVIFHEGGSGRDVLVILNGLAKVSKVALNGRSVLLEVRGRGELLGELAAIDAAPRSASAVALVPCTVAAVPGQTMWKVLGDNGRIARAMLAGLARRVRDASEHQLELGTSEAMARVARRLLLLHEMQGGTPEFSSPLTQQELAEWAGVSRDAVIRSLTALRNAGLIDTARRRFVVPDVAGLARVADQPAG